MSSQSPDRADAAPSAEGKPLMNLGRDVNGRFRSGNPGGPGNPFARNVASLRMALLEAISHDDVKEVIEAIKEKARQGDVPAARLLLSYAIGKPTEAKDPDRMDIEEWQWLQEMRVSLQQLKETVNSLPACLSSFLASLHWACNTQSNALVPLAAGLTRTGDLRPAPDAPSANGDAGS